MLLLLQADDEDLLPSPRSSQAVLPAHMGSPRALLSGQGSEYGGRGVRETVDSSASEAEYDGDFVEAGSPWPESGPDMRLPSQGGLVSPLAACCMKVLLSKRCQMVCPSELCTCGSVNLGRHAADSLPHQRSAQASLGSHTVPQGLYCAWKRTSCLLPPHWPGLRQVLQHLQAALLPAPSALCCSCTQYQNTVQQAASRAG